MELGSGAVRVAYLHRVNLRAGGLTVPVSTVSPLWYLRQSLLRAH